MYLKIDDMDIYYKQYGKGKDIIFLHGWGQNSSIMDPVGEKLMNYFKITSFDLPGFGRSSEPPSTWNVYNYYELLDKCIRKLKIKNPIIIGHSFGGRIAMIYTALKKTNKLVIFASPYEKSLMTKSLKVKILKGMKKIPIINRLENIAKMFIGSTDYKKASLVMKKILVSTVNEDLTKYVLKIKVPTLLIWGDQDKEVPLSAGEKLKTLVEDSGLIIYKGNGHYAYLENLPQTINILNKFLEEDKGGN
jgi:pimeloyl-ACP methyl ester carboxylesterase